MPNVITLTGVEQAIANLAQLPRKVALRHLRIALNAAGGTIRNAAKAIAPRDTGLIRQSLGVKVKIPDASWDVKHHGRPAYVIIGAKRRVTGKKVRRERRVHGVAEQKILAAGKGRNARITDRGTVVIAAASRYLHLAEAKHKFMDSASKTAGPAASDRAAEKLAKAFETEAAALPK